MHTIITSHLFGNLQNSCILLMFIPMAGHWLMAADIVRYPPRLRAVSLRRESATGRKKMLLFSYLFV